MKADTQFLGGYVNGRHPGHFQPVGTDAEGMRQDIPAEPLGVMLQGKRFA
jgi:hypothetical protein